MTTYYVSSESGSDSNNGTSSSQAFATLQRAADQTKPGDVVQVMNGTYNSSNGVAILDITHSGSSGAPITYEAASGQHPVIDSTGTWNGIYVDGASYININGFEVRGDAANISDSYAQSQASSSNPNTGADGISVHSGTHVTMQNNDVHDQPGSGIAAVGSDYISVLDNTVADNAWRSPDADSGISILQSHSSDSNTGVKTTVSGNTVYGNQQLVDWQNHGITDGNGIIIDSNNDSGYNGRTLVENNVTYDNGGPGALSYRSDNVDFLYNTSYGNDQSSGLNDGQIIAEVDSGNQIEHNIMVATSGKAVDLPTYGQDVTYNYNDYYGGSVGARGSNDIVANPEFVDPSNGDFQLQSGSPASGLGASGSSSSQQASASGSSSTSSPSTSSSSTSGSSTSANGTDTLVLHLSADVWQGDPTFIVSVDGKKVGSGAVSASHSNGNSQDFTFSGDFGSGQHDIAVTYNNDAYGGTPSTDRNLYVNSIDYNGQHYGSATAAMHSDGTANFMVGTGS